MNNISLVKKTAPFLLIFTIIFVFTVATYMQQNAYKTSAQYDGVGANLTNITAPLIDNADWVWRIDISATKHIGEEVTLEHTINWCENSFGKKGENSKNCSPDIVPKDFLNNLYTDPIKLKIENTNVELAHKAVQCGRVYIELKAFDNVIGSQVYDTGVTCSKQYIRNFASKEFTPKTAFANEDVTSKQSEAVSNFFENILNQFMGGKIKNDPIVGTGEPGQAPSGPSNQNPLTPRGGTDVQNAINLYNSILAKCGGVLTQANKDCVDGLDLPENLKEWLKGKQDCKDCVLQCTEFVAVVASMATGNGIGGFGHAVSWYDNPPTGYSKSSSSIKEGDIAVFNWDGYGHVAYVTEVFPDGSFTVVEANMGIGGSVRQQRYTADQGGLIGWLTR